MGGWKHPPFITRQKIMNAKKALTIGLLTITAIGLVGCAIVLSKNKNEYKPKTLETSAYYNFTNITENVNGTDFTITGSPSKYGTQGNSSTEGDPYIFSTLTGTYTLTKTNATLTTTFNFVNVIAEDGTDNPWPINTIQINPTTLTYNVAINVEKTINKIELIQIYLDVEGFPEQSALQRCEYTFKTLVTYTDSTTSYNANTISLRINTTRIYIEPAWDTNYIWEEIPILTNLNTYEHAYNTGYTTGYQTAGDISDGNFLSLKNLMLNILTMPFTFMNQAFNLTLWEGTAHSFNVGLFIRTIIAISAILFIIRMFTSGFSLLGNYTGGYTDKRLDRQQKKANIAKTKAETAKIEKKDK